MIFATGWYFIKCLFNLVAFCFHWILCHVFKTHPDQEIFYKEMGVGKCRIKYAARFHCPHCHLDIPFVGTGKGPGAEDGHR